MENIVLLTGRGGSGTRLLSDLASHADIFLGNELNISGDSLEWVEFVYDLVEQTGNGEHLPTGDQYRSAIKLKAREILNGEHLDHGRLWGIKLPELMLVLPLFIDAFPKARVIHLIRDPVSISLRRSHMTSRLDNRVGQAVLAAAYRYCRRNLDMLKNDEVYMQNACSWLYQVERIARYGRNQLNKQQYLELYFEGLCGSPGDNQRIFYNFLGLEKQIHQQININRERAKPWNTDTGKAKEVWDMCGGLAKELGYPFMHEY